MTKLGFMMPNTEWADWLPSDMNAVSDVKPSVIVVPLYDVHNPYFALRLQKMQQIRALLPDCTFLWRMMQDKPTLQDPVWWAGECNKRIDAVRPYLPESMHIICWNEANVEGMGEDWARLVTWINTFMQAISKRSSIIHLPALSPSGNYHAGIDAMKAVSSQFAAADAHIYDTSQENDAPYIQQAYGLPTWVTEFNRILASSLLARLPTTVQGASWFILRGTPDQAMYNLVEPYYSDMKETIMSEASPPVPPVQSPSAYTPLIDLSSNNGQVNASLLAESGYRAGFIKVSQSTDYVNTLLKQQTDAAHAAGLITGYYHFADPDANPDPTKEADYFLAHLPESRRPLALDIEIGSGALQAWCTIWLQHVQQKVGYAPYFYSGAWFMYPHLLHDNTDLNKFPLWLSHPDPTTWPDPIPSWPNVKINQYGQGNVLGIAGMVDLDMFNGTLEEFIASGQPPI